MATEFTDANFKEQVLDSDKRTVIDFLGCVVRPCRMVAPVIEELAKDYDGQVNIGKVDVDSNPMVNTSNSVSGIYLPSSS